MSTSKKRKANQDEDEQLSSELQPKRNRSETDSNHSAASTSNSTVTRPHYSPLASSTHKPSPSSDTARIWNPNDSISSSRSSHSESESMVSPHGPVVRTHNDLDTMTMNHGSMSYNPNHQMAQQPDHRFAKRELSPSLNGTPPPKRNPRGDYLSTLPTPPPSVEYSSAAAKMMERMGYDKSRGLGRHADGPTQLIEDSKQKGRRGLGFSFKDFTADQAGWRFEDDPAPVDEEVLWCPPSEHPEAPLTLDELCRWIEMGPKKRVIDNEIEFCDEDILQDMLLAKTVFDELPQKEMEEARARSNVYETIGQSIFLNRAAVKMANIDLVFGRMFTDPKTADNQRSLVHPDEPLYFADVCAGPGGFSEYILWKKKWLAKGFGFTLRGKSDFALHKFLVGAPETFDPYYGVDGDGDVFKSGNIDSLRNYVLKCTMGNGVHTAMADGGFSVEGQENIQEILSKQLYLCQFLTALSILRPGGHFVCKLFDIFTPFSVGLIYLMYRTFDQISIHKPVTSRPANSERYIICKGLRGEIRDVVHPYMYEINALQNKYGSDTEPNDVQSIVPMEVLKGNQQFYQYIRDSNNELGQLQIRNLRKIRAFVKNTALRDERQSGIREQCLNLWEVPNEPRQRPRRLTYDEIQSQLLPQLDRGIENVLFTTPTPLKKSVLVQHKIESLFDYRCVLALGDPVLLLSCGRSSVFALELKGQNKRWMTLDRTPFKIELPPYTLLLAERVQETFTEGRNNRSRPVIYIIDAYFISNENVLFQNGRPVVFNDRYRTLKMFEKVINKPARVDLVPIRVSEQLRLEQMDDNFEKLRMSDLSDRSDNEKLWFTNMDIENKPRVPVRGLWIFKFIQNPWTMLLSKSSQRKYFHNKVTRASIPSAPPDSSNVATLRAMLEHSFYWDFNNLDDPVLRSTFLAFIQEKNREIQSQQQRIDHPRTTSDHN